MSVKERGWVSVARFEEAGARAKQEKERIEEIALDLGLMPEKVVAMEESAGRVEIFIHPEFYSYYEG
ncbi:MAG: hypothetical protein ACLFSY_04885 [Desulfonatronovibrionaceae bacterium]